MADKVKNIKVLKQNISIFICWLAYTCVYFGRFSYSANIAIIESDYGVTHASAGLVMTFFSVAYGVGQMFHGIFCSKYPRRFIVPFALIVPAIMDVMIFFKVPFFMVKYLWFISALCQSLLWPMLMQILSENISDTLIKRAILAMSTTTSIGTLIVYGLSAVLAGINYKLTFLFGSVILLIVSVTWIFLYEPGDYLKEKTNPAKSNGNSKPKMQKHFIFVIALLVVFSIATNFVRDGIQTWVPVILKAIKPDLTDRFSILLTLILPLLGFLGATLAVGLNRKINKVIPLTMMLLGFSAFFNLIVFLFGNSIFITVTAFGILELLLHGVSNTLVNIFPLSVRDKIGTGALVGILNGSAYAGTAASSYVLGKIADISGGWSAVFLTLLGTVCSMLLLGTVYLLISVKKPELNP